MCGSRNNTGAIYCFSKNPNSFCETLHLDFSLHPLPRLGGAPSACNQSTSFTQTPAALPCPPQQLSHQLNGLKTWGFSAKKPPCAASSAHILYCTSIYGGAESPARTIACALRLTLSKGFPGIGLLLFFLSPHPRISGMLSLSI